MRSRPIFAPVHGRLKRASNTSFSARSRLRLFAMGRPVAAPVAQWLCASLAALTMLGGNLLALPQRNVKRMLAYSSIAHAGYVLLGVTALFAAPRSSRFSLLHAASGLPMASNFHSG